MRGSTGPNVTSPCLRWPARTSHHGKARCRLREPYKTPTLAMGSPCALNPGHWRRRYPLQLRFPPVESVWRANRVFRLSASAVSATR